MRNIVSIEALQDRKSGKITTVSLVEDLHELALRGKLEDVTIAFTTKEGNKVYSWWSTDSLRVLGLLQTGIDQILYEMREGE